MEKDVRSLFVVSISLIMLCLVLGACESQFAILKPADGSIVIANDNRVSATIALGSGNPATFQCVLNGKDVTDRFTISFSQARTDSLEAALGRNTLVAYMEDPQSGITMERRATFFVFHLEPVMQLPGIEQAALSYTTNEMVVVAKQGISEERYVKEITIDPAPAHRTIAGPLTGEAVITGYANKFQYYLLGSSHDQSIYTIRIASDGTPIPDLYYQNELLQGLGSIAIFTPLVANETEHTIEKPLYAGISSPQGGGQGAILRINPDKTSEILLDGLQTRPQAMVFDHNETLIVAVGNRLLWVSEDGEIERSKSLPQGSYPVSLALNLDGDVFLLDANSGSVKVVTPEDNLMTLISDLTQPCAIAIDGKENLFVVERETGTISKLSGDLSLFGGDVSLGDSIGPLKAFRNYTIPITYTAGRAGLPRGAAIAVGFRVGTGWPPLQVSDPSGPAYVTASTDASASLDLGMDAGPFLWLAVRVAEGNIMPGQHIFLVLGDTSPRITRDKGTTSCPGCL